MKIIYIKSFFKIFFLSYNLVKQNRPISERFFLSDNIPNPQNNAGDRSFINFYKLYCERHNAIIDFYCYNNQSFNNDIIKYKEVNNIIYERDVQFIFRSPEAFFELILHINIFRNNISYEYYSTDLFFKRYFNEFLKTKKISSLLISLFYYFSEKYIWKCANKIYSNRSDELNHIKKYNKNSVCIPTRYFDHHDYPAYDLINSKLSNENLYFIFVGSSGNTPNISSLNIILSTIWPLIISNLKYKNCILYIVGSGWDNIKNNKNILNMNIVFYEKISDSELEILYHKSAFSFGYLTYGSGVKGKVIESMAYNVVCLSNKIGNDGIYCTSLYNLESSEQIIKFIKICLDDTKTYWNTTLEYFDYISKNYNKKNIISKI